MRHGGDIDFDQQIVRQVVVDVHVERRVDEVCGIRRGIRVDKDGCRLRPTSLVGIGRPFYAEPDLPERINPAKRSTGRRSAGGIRS